MKKIPTWWANSIYDIDYDLLKKEGKKVIFFDLDNTITKPKNKKPTDEEIKLIEKLKKDFTIYVISNNNEKRVGEYCKDLGIKYLSMALKPLLFRTKKFFKDENLNKDEIVFVGDQIYTDVKFARRLKVDCVLLERISDDEPWNVKLKRKLESKIKKKYKKYSLVKEMGEIHVK